ncbi:hypothetical protein GFS31_41000 (plasmid) [Leptolyngbya sp. BL0902]|nr:hypothetical protein GFS31_41000 [Leptolyngbya sp. BL0902]
MISSVLIIFATGSQITQKPHSLVEAVDAILHKGFSPCQRPKNGLLADPKQTPSIQGIEILAPYGFQ